MAYNSGINQRVRKQEFFQNTIAEDQPLTQTNLGLLANLKYVQQLAMNSIVNALPVLNPIFQGILTGTNLNTNSLTVDDFNNNSNFTGIPTINNNNIDYNIIGEIIFSVSNIAPNNFIVCNGQSLNVVDYQELFNVIGYNYGGSGESFNVPNFHSKFFLGGNDNINNVSVSNYATNGFINSYNFQNYSASNPSTISQVLDHTHRITDPGHEHGLNGITNVFLIPLDITPSPYDAFSLNSPEPQILTALTGITGTENSGQNIANAPVNVTPPFISFNFFICVNTTN
jgi:microcystin-dependent protein